MMACFLRQHFLLIFDTNYLDINVFLVIPVLPGIMRNSFAPDGPDAEARREDEANDCITDRQAVLDEQVALDICLLVLITCPCL